MMDKSSNSSGDSSAVSASTTSSTGNNNNGNRDHHYLRQINKLSHKISKPTTTTSSSVSAAAAVNREIDHQSFPPPPLNQGNLHQHQPPVYNINKNDFRDVVQKLTGSPAHERISAPPQQPIHHPKPQQSSRLHRIRPPPLAHVINRPPGLLNDAHIPQGPNHHNWGGGFVPRPTAPLSPLPPLPPVHAAAESPVSSYMRYLHNSMATFDSNRKEISGLSPLAPLVSPRWYQQQQQSENFPPPRNNARPPPPSASGTVSPTTITATQSMGCLNSPKSPYGLLSPSILLSPTSGQLGFPVSTATVPLSSPKYKGH